MKCSRCGANIKDDSVYCDVCGEEVRIVPDYSSLDELLAAHVRGEIETDRHPQKSGRKTTNQNVKRREPQEQTRPRRKKRNKKKKTMLIILGILLSTMLIGCFIYQSSYGGLIERGYNALDKEKYNAAIKYFNLAAGKNVEKADAYVGLSKVYIQQKDLSSAEDVFLTQIEEQENNADIYRSAAEFYVGTKQVEKIPVMLEKCTVDSVLSAMSDYVVKMPNFSLEEGTYEEMQKLELSSGKNTVYYTLDESEPTVSEGTKHGTEIELDEGEWIVKAIAVNENGIPSLVTEKKYIIELPVSDPPIVSPSTGLYESEMEISIQVEEGFTAYYVFDQTELTPENGKRYTGPIQMPEGNHIFSAILVDDETKKVSGTTVRNYDLKLNVDSETAEEE